MTDLGGADSDPRNELILNEARRAIELQIQDLAGLRSRSAALAGYAVAVAGFLGGIALRDGGSDGGWLFASIVTLVGSVIAAVYIQLPRTFTFSLDVPGMDARIDSDHTLDQMTRDTSLGLDTAHESNKKTLNSMHLVYALGLIALVAEVVFLLVDLTRR